MQGKYPESIQQTTQEKQERTLHESMQTITWNQARKCIKQHGTRQEIQYAREVARNQALKHERNVVSNQAKGM